MNKELVEAIKNKNEKLALKLIDEIITNKENINEQDPNNGYTYLMWTARKGCEELFDKLVEVKADFSIKNKDGWNVGMVAAHYGYTSICLKVSNLQGKPTLANGGYTWVSGKGRVLTKNWTLSV